MSVLTGVFGRQAGRREGRVAAASDGRAPAVSTGTLVAAADAREEGGIVVLVDGRVIAEPPTALRPFVVGERSSVALCGEFVVLAFEPSSGRGAIVRDALGHRSLFVFADGPLLWFASELKPLLAMLDRRPAPDPVAAAHWLARTTAPERRTLYEGVRTLPAGHLIRFDGERWATERWWAPRYVQPARREMPEAAAELRAHMAAAVERSIADAPPAGVLLSGGFDSASVAALAARSRPPGAVTAYSTVFPDDRALDESERIRAVRSFVGLRGVEHPFRGGSALAASLRFLAAWGAPSLSPNLFAWAPLLASARADGVELMIDGEGGDEIFGCSPYIVADRLARGRIAGALAAAWRLPGMAPGVHPRRLARALVRYGVRPLLPGARDRAPAPHWLREEVARVHHETHDPRPWDQGDGPRWWRYLAYVVTAGDAMGAPEQLRREGELAGVEARHPLLDVDLLEAVLRLPPLLAFDPVLDRRLARESMRGALPEPVRTYEGKVFFNALLASALEGVDRGALEALLGDARAEVRAYATAEGIRDLLAERPGRPFDLWRLVTLECWLRTESDPRFIDRAFYRLEPRATSP